MAMTEKQSCDDHWEDGRARISSYKARSDVLQPHITKSGAMTIVRIMFRFVRKRDLIGARGLAGVRPFPAGLAPDPHEPSGSMESALAGMITH